MIIPALAALAVPIDSVYCDPANARTGHDLDGIAASLKKYGQRTPVVANKDGVILKGNGTYTAAKTRLGWTEIAAVVVDDDSVTATGYAIADNRLGDLSRFDDSVLKSLLASIDEPLEIPGIDAEFLASLDDLRVDFGGSANAAGEAGKGSENFYSDKIKPPVYTPKDESPPNLQEIYDKARHDELCREIKSSSVPHDIKDFLLLAATRHIVFDFEKIAEFYCHADKDTQLLFEKSALVIIDFNSAIDNGYVHITKALGSLADMESGSDE